MDHKNYYTTEWELDDLSWKLKSINDHKVSMMAMKPQDKLVEAAIKGLEDAEAAVTKMMELKAKAIKEMKKKHESME